MVFFKVIAYLKIDAIQLTTAKCDANDYSLSPNKLFTLLKSSIPSNSVYFSFLDPLLN